MSKHRPQTYRNSQIAKRLLENYRSSRYRTTASGRRVQWDEPGEQDSAEIKRHNVHLSMQRQQRASRERLKSKGMVPTKDGKPLFEKVSAVHSTTVQYLQALRHLYDASQTHRFEEWILEVVQVVDQLP